MSVERIGFETKAQIFSALKHLVENGYPSKSVSVTDICKEAGVSRQTFYNHFKDKYAVTQWFFDLVSNRYLHEAGRSLSYYEANLFTNRIFASNLTMVSALLKENGYQALGAYAYRGRKEELVRTITQYKGLEITRDLELILDYHVTAETSLVGRWIKDGALESPERFAEIQEECVPRKLYEIIGKPTPGCDRPVESMLQFVLWNLEA